VEEEATWISGSSSRVLAIRWIGSVSHMMVFDVDDVDVGVGVGVGDGVGVGVGV